MSRHITGTRDITYNLVSALYHQLQQADTLSAYIADAERADDRELADYFRQLLESSRHAADEAKVLLNARLGKAASTAKPPAPAAKGKDAIEQASMDSFPASDSPATY